MGYSDGTFRLLESWSGSHLKSGDAVLELGAQTIGADVEPETVSSFIRRYRDAPPVDVHSKMVGGPTAAAFKAAGFHYKSIDFYEGEDILQLDLNVDDLPDQDVAYYDLVTNMGTTEHIANQVQAFKVVHDALKVGGISFHSLPAFGYLNHGLFKYEPIFFVFLAHANDYEINHLSLGPPHFWSSVPAYLKADPYWRRHDSRCGLVDCILRKTSDEPFSPPMDIDATKIASTVNHSHIDKNLLRMIRERYRLVDTRSDVPDLHQLYTHASSQRSTHAPAADKGRETPSREGRAQTAHIE